MPPDRHAPLSSQEALLFVQALTDLGEGLLVLGGASPSLRANEAFCRLVGASSPKETSLEDLLERLHPDDRAALEEDLGGQEPFKREIRLHRPDGQGPLWLEARGKRLDGLILILLNDISRRKAFEARLLRSESRFQTLFEASADGILLFDFEGTLLDVNPSLCRTLGRAPSELYHKNVADLLAPADRSFLQNVILGAAEKGEDLFEMRLIDADGAELPMEINACRTTYLDREVIVATCRDLTERKNLEDSIRAKEERLRLALDMNRDGIWDFDLERDEIYLSPGWYRLLGLPVREAPLPWKNLYERLHPEDQEETDGLDREGLTGERPLSLECRFRTVRGNWHWILVRGRLVKRDRHGRPLRLIGTFSDIDDRKRLEKAYEEERLQLRDCSERDDLTGLNNRRSLEGHFQTALSLTRRKDLPLSLILLDIDDFKAVNDTFGHLMGDDVLVQVAQCLREKTRPSDLLCRWGGEEMLVVVHEDEEGAARLADRLRQALSDVMASPDQPVTASFGVARWEEGLSLLDLFERADRAMYRAKRLGKDRVVRWSALKGAPGRSE